MTGTVARPGRTAPAYLRCERLGSAGRRLARKCGLSEAELVAEGAVRLDRTAELLLAASTLGTVLGVTCTEYAVLAKTGRYERVSVGPERGAVFNHDIDLRLAMRHWRYAFAVKYRCPPAQYSSLQFFDQYGEAVHKIWMLEGSNHAAYQEVVAKFAAPLRERGCIVEKKSAQRSERPDPLIDRHTLRARWAALQDTHEFSRMLETLQIGRLQALRLAGDAFASRVITDAVQMMLCSVAEWGTPIVAFVGNSGCLQIHTGSITNVVAGRRWLSVVDPGLRLRLRQDRIGSNWIVRKPTRNGVLTSLEAYDTNDQLIVQFFGAREPGMPEREDWRSILSDLPLHTI